jgi:hypothetical protein
MGPSLSIRVRFTLLTGLFCACASGCSSDSDDSNSDSDGGGGSSAGSPTGGSNATGGTSGVAGATGGRASGGSAGRSGGTGGASSGSGGAGTGGRTVEPGRPVAPTCEVTPGTAPSASWTNVTGDLAGMDSECGNLTLVAADPCSTRVIAGVARAGLWTSSGDGTWTKLGSGAGSADIVNRPSSIVFDPENPEVFYESGIYGNFNDGLYKTTDGGETFVQLGGDVGHNDLMSVDFHDPERNTILAGGHEMRQTLYLSRDGGETFTDIGPNLPADAHISVAPLVLDRDTFLLGACGSGDGTCGVLRSLDGGESWSYMTMESPEARPLWSLAGDIYWSTIFSSGMIVGDGAGENWTKVDGPRTAYPAELPDGRVVTVGNDNLIVSSDKGRTWTNIGQPLPYTPAGVTYSAAAKAFYIWQWDCGDVVLPNAIMRAGYDWEN